MPPSVTHNINILLPRELRKTSFYIASMWDTTKMLAKYLTGEKIYGNPNARKSKTRVNNKSITLDITNRAKMDLVLLVIMNGNDYLPKVRGVSGGFDSFFASYFKLVKAHLKSNEESSDQSSFLINMNKDSKLSINVPFALKYFQKMLSYEPPEIARLIEDGSEIDTTQYQLGILHNLCDAKMLPSPIRIQIVQIGNSSYFETIQRLNSKLKSETLKSIESFYGEDVEIVRMTLGEHEFDLEESSMLNATILGENDGHGVIARMIPEDKDKGRSFLFEVPHRQGGLLQETKRRLACLALEEIFGKENMDLFGYNGAIDDSEEVDDDDLSNEKVSKLCVTYTHSMFVNNISHITVSPMKTERIQADVKSYLSGLLWTLETYQRGHCPDWGYNYGHRAAPAVTEVNLV